MERPDLTPARLEAFSDGVIAIIITIMVLELKVPHEETLKALLRLWPTFLSYILSYMMVAIYWINHHHLFHKVKRVDPSILWANSILLFFLSLIPFFTAFMGENRISSFAVTMYGILLLICAISFWILRYAIYRQNHDDDQRNIVYRAANRKNNVAMFIYASAIGVAHYNTSISLLLIFSVAALYIVPTAWIDRYIGK